MTITAGNNGRLYVIFPRKAMLMALDVSTGSILWQHPVGPLSGEKSFPIVDSNGKNPFTFSYIFRKKEVFTCSLTRVKCLLLIHMRIMFLEQFSTHESIFQLFFSASPRSVFHLLRKSGLLILQVDYTKRQLVKQGMHRCSLRLLSIFQPFSFYSIKMAL